MLLRNELCEKVLKEHRITTLSHEQQQSNVHTSYTYILTALAVLTQRVAHTDSAVHGKLLSVAGNFTGLAHPALGAVPTHGIGYRPITCTPPIAVVDTVGLVTAPPLPALRAHALSSGLNKKKKKQKTPWYHVSLIQV